MLYLIIQILLCLLLAFILGFLVGWLLKIFPQRKRLRDIEETLASLENQNMMNSKNCNEQIKKLKTELSAIAAPESVNLEEQNLNFERRLNRLEEKMNSSYITISDKTDELKYDIPLTANENLMDSSSVKDDLKLISGVGPVLEKFLNENGIYNFRQVAELSEDIIQSISQNLGAFQDRIVRDKWVEQAHDLYFKKYGERI